MSRHPANNGKVMLTAWIDPVMRDYARQACAEMGIDFSAWIERSIQRSVALESAERAIRDAAKMMGLCEKCGFNPCECHRIGSPR